MKKKLRNTLLEAVDMLRNTGDGLDSDAATFIEKAILRAERKQALKEHTVESTTPLPAADYGTRPVALHPLDYVTQTAQFMKAAGQNIPDTPKQPLLDVAMLRLSLCCEELYELAQAMGLEYSFQKMLAAKAGMSNSGGNRWIGDIKTENTYHYDAVEVLDALGDMAVVHAGTVLACGMQEAFPEAMAEISRSNLSKFPDSEVRCGIDARSFVERGVPVTIKPAGVPDKWVILHTETSKVQKSTGYSPANLAPILRKFTT